MLDDQITLEQENRLARMRLPVRTPLLDRQDVYKIQHARRLKKQIHTGNYNQLVGYSNCFFHQSTSIEPRLSLHIETVKLTSDKITSKHRFVQLV